MLYKGFPYVSTDSSQDDFPYYSRKKRKPPNRAAFFPQTFAQVVEKYVCTFPHTAEIFFTGFPEIHNDLVFFIPIFSKTDKPIKKIFDKG